MQVLSLSLNSIKVPTTKHLRSSSLGVLLLSHLALAAQGQEIPVSTPQDALPDTADLVPWPVKGYPEVAPGSVVNAGSWLLDAPAGKHGFVQAQPNGQLAFEDKTPVRFWGTTLVYAMTFPDKTEDIVKLADSIAASGYNLVRFHHNDVPWNGSTFLQTNPGSNTKLDPKGIDRLDRLAAELFKRGIYVYLDLVDSREIFPEDEFPDAGGLKKVGNGGWKGLFPHPKVVAAWKRSVTELLSHKNPYTGRTWGQEPGVATIEIINENGLFWDWNFKLTDPIRQWHNEQWNTWLLTKYGTRSAIDSRWTDADGKKGLYDGEDPAKNTVFAPPIGQLLEWDRSYRSKTRGAARVNDFYEFLADTATHFYQDATTHIRALGFKGIVIGSHELQGPINQYAEVKGTGSIAAHLYANGNTAWNARPTVSGATLDGVDVKTNNWFANIPRIKVAGAPGINGEWAGGTLTRRADVNMAVAAISAFQGIAQSLHFSFGHRSSGVGPHNFDTSYEYASWRGGIGFTFTSLHDEPWMAVNRICAPLFIRGDFAKPKAKVHIAFSREDRLEQNLHALGASGGSGTVGGGATFLPMLHEVECAFFEDAYGGDADVVFMTGRSASGDYRRARHAVLIGDNPYSDHYHKKRDIGVPARFVNPSAKVVTLKTPTTFQISWPYDKARTLQFDQLEGAVELASIPKGAQPIGRSADGKYTLGWLDDRFLVLPNGRAYGSRVRDIQWLYRLYLTAAKRWKIDTADNAPSATFYRSDTREMTVDWGTGTLAIDTPRTQGFSGFMGWRQNNAAKNLSATIDAPYGNVLATSTDGKPLSESRRILLVATGRMQNSGQELGKNKDGFLSVTQVGKAPIFVEGLRGEVRLTSTLAPTLSIYALDSAGRRLGKVTTSVNNGRIVLPLSPRWGTIWYEIATPEVTAPSAPAGTTWPLDDKPRANKIAAPTMVAVNSFWDQANGALRTASTNPELATPTATSTRFLARNLGDGAFIGSYSNIKLDKVQDPEKGSVLRAQFGKVNQDWVGGIWSELNTPTGAKPEDGVGFGFMFKGDGTAPRDSFLTLRTASGVPYRSKNLRTLFENDAWQDVLLKPTDFTIDPDYAKKNAEAVKTLSPTPDWGSINRMDFVCIGPLMDAASTGHFGEFYFVLAKSAEAAAQPAEAFRAGLPSPTVLKSNKITIPFVTETIKADGKPDEAAWKQALPIKMSEDSVPDWNFFGSHVVGGKLLNSEGADFWLLGTPAGLAVTSEIHKGSPEVFTERGNFYEGDSLEIFTDPENTGGKPAKQLFLAYSRPNLDRAAASDPAIQIGRAKLTDGYVLESVIPWPALGFKEMPTGEFGLELQVDFAQKGRGRTLQMTYATGTNEAWIKAEHYLKARINK